MGPLHLLTKKNGEKKNGLIPKGYTLLLFDVVVIFFFFSRRRFVLQTFLCFVLILFFCVNLLHIFKDFFCSLFFFFHFPPFIVFLKKTSFAFLASVVSPRKGRKKKPPWGNGKRAQIMLAPSYTFLFLPFELNRI